MKVYNSLNSNAVVDAAEGLKHEESSVLHEILVATGEEKVVGDDLQQIETVNNLVTSSKDTLQFSSRRSNNTLA